MPLTEIAEKSVTGAVATSATASVTRKERNPSVGIHMGKEVRIGSRKVQIVHVKKFNILPTDPKAQSIRDEVIKKVGSEWLANSRDIMRGLTEEEEIKYLPILLGAKPGHDEWEEKTKLFWADFSVAVPGTKEGLTFEAGFKFKNNISDEAEPISIIGYIQYNWCLKSSFVCKEDDANPAKYDFKLIDLAKDLLLKENEFALRKVVDTKYLQLISSKDVTERLKIDWIIEAKGGPNGYGLNTFNMNDVQKEMELNNIKEKNLAEFDRLISDPDLETKAMIHKAVTSRNIILDGDSTYILDDKIIGTSLKGAVAWLNDPNNSNKRLILAERLKELNR